MLEKRLRIDDTPCPAKLGTPRGNGSHLPHPARKQMLTSPPPLLSHRFSPSSDPQHTAGPLTLICQAPAGAPSSLWRKARRAKGAAPALPTVAPRELQKQRK